MENSTVTEIETFLDPVTDDVKRIIKVTNYVILCELISLFGIGSNISNICVFVRQGFKESINISLLGLAIADLVCSVTMLWSCFCDIPLFDQLDLPFVFLDVMYITGGWPHICFNRLETLPGKGQMKIKEVLLKHYLTIVIRSAVDVLSCVNCPVADLYFKCNRRPCIHKERITSFITAFITLERCLCIATPLKVKNIITPFRTKVINVSIFLAMIVLFSPFYFVTKLEWVFNVSRNRSLLMLTFTKDREIVDSVTYFIHSVFLSTVLLISVLISTIILVVKLNSKTNWRKTVVQQTLPKVETTTIKDKKIIKMIILISAIFIVCYIPPTVNFFAMACYPDFSISGKFQNTFFVTWSVAFILEAVNSSVNIFVYFNMSSKFKATIHEIFCECWKKH